MEFKDYYKILNVEPDADKKAIKVAYRKLARKYHPDVSDHKDAEDKFKEVTEAYEVLYDDKKRAEYDELKQYGSQEGGFRPPPGWQPGSLGLIVMRALLAIAISLISSRQCLAKRGSILAFRAGGNRPIKVEI